MKVIIVDNIDSFVYNLYQYVGELGGEPEVVPNTITVEEILEKAPDRIILSPGPGKPENAGSCVEIIQKLGPRIPIMGVCLGHQAIGIAFGGIVSRAFAPLHGKSSSIMHDGRGIYAGIRDSIVAGRYHSLTVKQKGLPDCLQVTARSDDGEIMGIRHREYPIEGVQFHPESILTDYGKVILKNFLYRGV
jgi:anthranilate synthase/aminodeoxychorismate synthase-like glutamine amidotransferase